MPWIGEPVRVRDVEVREIETTRGLATEEKGLLELPVEGKPSWKRFVLRYPELGSWNGKLVVGAHGGSGGEAFSRDGRVIGTDETALDDVIGEHALEKGFAYASLDRDGIGGTREGLRLTRRFTGIMKERLGSNVERTYLVGLSMGGGIARYAAEESPSAYHGLLVIAGAHGDASGREDRRKRCAASWPRVDPGKVAQPSEADLLAYAEAIGTPVAARRFWPFTGASLSSDPVRGAEETSGELKVPTIEIVGTFDDFVLPEILAYERKVRSKGAGSRYRLYQVEGAWHISSDDDAISSFQYAGSRMGLSEASLEALATGATYLPIVREALLLLDRWVSEGEAPPPGRTLKDDESLLP
jgi:pimeloyl-ACP methyl ester carboxylesterase